MNDRDLRILTAAILYAGARIEYQAAENHQSGTGGEAPELADYLARAQELIEAEDAEQQPPLIESRAPSGIGLA